MSKFDEITERFNKVPYMKKRKAEILRNLIEDEGAEEILEIGFFQGKSSAYISAILEDRGRGRLLTIDREGAEKKSPSIHDLLRDSQLMHRVEPVFAFRSYTWELQKLISREPRPKFDFCYFDGGHTWDQTGFGALLVDMLLKPGGILLLDDIDWSISTSPSFKRRPGQAAKYSEDEAASQSVRRVWDLILPYLGYEHVREIPEAGWAVARKAQNAGASDSA